MKIEADETLENLRADLALIVVLNNDISRSKIQKCFNENLVFVNSKVAKSSQKIKTGDLIEFELAETENSTVEAENIPLNIVFEDDNLLVVNKQKGLLTHPTPKQRTGTLVNALLNYGCPLSDTGGKERPGIVHRLDKNTSGLMLVAKTNEAHLNLQEQIKTKYAKRKYLAVLHGIISENKGTIEKPLIHNIKKTVKMGIAEEGKGLNATTLFKVLKRYEDLTLAEIELKTGRTHQIRAHFASINHPVYGDSLYGAKGFKSKLNLKTQEQLLMSYFISFKHPKYDKIMEFELKKEDYDKDFKCFFKMTGE